MEQYYMMRESDLGEARKHLIRAQKLQNEFRSYATGEEEDIGTSFIKGYGQQLESRYAPGATPGKETIAQIYKSSGGIFGPAKSEAVFVDALRGELIEMKNAIKQGNADRKAGNAGITKELKTDDWTWAELQAAVGMGS